MPGSTIYINGMAITSPQKTGLEDPFLQDVIVYDKNVLTCISPDFKTYLTPAQLRRLGRMMRIGLTTATQCLRHAGVETPDGIVTATGYGFLEETEKFLRELLEREEKQLTPTYFIHGTYNALSGLIGLATRCQGYSSTHVSKGSAFESALEDLTLQLAEHPGSQYLVGSYDEAVPILYAIGSREGYFKHEHVPNTQLFSQPTRGTLQGEGSAFFLISDKSSARCMCAIRDMCILFKPTEKELTDRLSSFLADNDIEIADLDLWISGAAGDPQKDQLIQGLAASTLQGVPELRFKHLCGEYCTATSFGLWLGARILSEQNVPAVVTLEKTPPIRQVNRVLLINHYLDRNYSFTLLDRSRSWL